MLNCDLTPLLRAWAKVRLARLAVMNPVEEQATQLRNLVRRARYTQFGYDHHFDCIYNVAGYQARVGLWTYETMWDRYWKQGYPVLRDCSWPGTIPYFAVTSGTSSGTTKNIPVSSAMNRSNRRAALDLLCFHVRARPRSRIFAGKTFMLGGSTDFQEVAPGVYSGDLSGIAAATMPRWAQALSFPQPDLEISKDWSARIEMLAKASVNEPVRAISGVPSWLLLLFDRVMAERRALGQPPIPVFPDLDLLVHGGVFFGPYREQFQKLADNGAVDFREVYPASEGFVAVADRGQGDGLRLMIDSGLFYEFVPVSELGAERPARHWVRTMETGQDYALHVTTCAGLWSYRLGDTVRVVSHDPPRIVVTGRTSWTLSAFGEHLTAEEVETAVMQAAAAEGLMVRDYAVGAVFPDDPGRPGGHRYIIEPEPDRESGGLHRKTDDRAARVGAAIDRVLCRLNDDYRVHRADGFGLTMPQVWFVPPGAFADWMKARGQLGGQHKVPRIIARPELFDDLSAFALRRIRQTSRR